MLRQLHEEGLSTQMQAKKYLGKTFRVKLSLPEWSTDVEVCDFLLKYVDCSSHGLNLMEVS